MLIQKKQKQKNACHTAEEARESVMKPYNLSGSITASFACTGKGKITYSHQMHTKTETKYVPVSPSPYSASPAPH